MIEFEQFLCDAHHCWLRRDLCAARWRKSNPKRALKRGTDSFMRARAMETPCFGCSTGATHARGEANEAVDVRIVELRARRRGAEAVAAS